MWSNQSRQSVIHWHHGTMMPNANIIRECCVHCCIDAKADAAFHITNALVWRQAHYGVFLSCEYSYSSVAPTWGQLFCTISERLKKTRNHTTNYRTMLLAKHRCMICKPNFLYRFPKKCFYAVSQTFYVATLHFCWPQNVLANHQPPLTPDCICNWWPTQLLLLVLIYLIDLCVWLFQLEH